MSMKIFQNLAIAALVSSLMLPPLAGVQAAEEAKGSAEHAHDHKDHKSGDHEHKNHDHKDGEAAHHGEAGHNHKDGDETAKHEDHKDHDHKEKKQ